MKTYNSPFVQIFSLVVEDVLTLSVQHAVNLDALDEHGGNYTNGTWSRY